jgi:ABC-type Fe3+/spermidine/putrescine transport system ATPase subunit
MTAPLLSLRGLTKSFQGMAAVAPIDLDVARGDFCAILGPSGCGKSTLLRMIAGFVEPSAGQVLIEGTDVTRLGPDKRPTNMVFQSYGLFLHLSVAKNVAFGLVLRKLPPEEVRARVADALRLVRLEGFDERPIDRLSGGQQQRVALARALIMRPKVLLLDEPLAALDLKLRHAMQDELRRIHAEIGGTFIFVTHDQNEAFALASRVVVMNHGRVEQVGGPEDVYLRPASLFAAAFVGETSILAGSRKDGVVTLDAGARFEDEGADGPVHAVVRPERVRVAPAGGIVVEAEIVEVVFLGATLKIVGRLRSGELLTARDIDVARRASYPLGATLSFGWSPADHRVIDGTAAR